MEKKTMKIHVHAKNFAVLLTILTAGLGCKYFGQVTGRPAPTPETRTAVTKEVLKERLGARLVKMTPAAEKSAPPPKPDPRLLHLRFAGSNRTFNLNGEQYASFRALADRLRAVFKSREDYGIFAEGTNNVYRVITLPAYDEFIAEYNARNIYVEDFERLVDDLRNEGLGDQLELDTEEENNFRAIRPSDLDEPPPPVNRREANRRAGDDDDVPPPLAARTISGGVLNGKATNLVKPPYPSAARAVRASGAVNVQVTVDEKGNVISANAVSGHPLLRSSAAEAARASKFAPTILNGNPVRVTGVIVYNFTPE